jgi:hypothetical protein
MQNNKEDMNLKLYTFQLNVKVALKFALLCVLYRFPGWYNEVPMLQRNVLHASSGGQMFL